MHKLYEDLERELGEDEDEEEDEEDFELESEEGEPEESFDWLEQYWAATPDSEELVQECMQKTVDYRDTLRQHPFWNRILRSLEYYHGFFYESLGFDDWFNDTALSTYGDQEELLQIDLNHLRSVLQQILNIVTQNPPNFKARAANSEAATLKATEVADRVLEHYNREKRVERFLRRAVEDALVLSTGFVSVTWDPSAGEEIDADPQAGTIEYEGDLHFTCPKLFDVAFDLRVREWENCQWVIIREQENKWDLAAEFPEHADVITAADPAQDNWTDDWNHVQETDMIDVYNFYHLDSTAIPGGRYCMYIPEAPLIDMENPYERLPLHRIVPAEVTNSPIGYSPSFDLQGPQEALNHEASTICSNHAAFGVQNVFSKTGNNILVSSLPGGMNLIEAEEMPISMNLTNTPPEIFDAFREFQGQIEILSGINAVARGVPQANLKSGAALALVDSKAIQASTGLAQNYRQLIEDVGTAMLKILQQAAETERVIEVVGKHDQVTQQTFTGEDLKGVARVVVESGNAYTDTVAGKTEMANHLMERGLIRNPQEYITVLKTGNLEPLMDAEMAQLRLVHDENEQLQEGNPQVEALPEDAHVMHVREHQSLLQSTQARGDLGFRTLVQAHMMQHWQFLYDPNIIYQMQVLGFEAPPPPMPPAPPLPDQGLPAGTFGTQGDPGAMPPGEGEPYEIPGYPGAGVNMPGMPEMPAATPQGFDLATV